MPRHPSLLGSLRTWTRSMWKCGCRDSACAQSYWQIQSFKRSQVGERELAKGKEKAPGATAQGMSELDSLAARVHRNSAYAL
jgi:hypothetical protein